MLSRAESRVKGRYSHTVEWKSAYVSEAVVDAPDRRRLLRAKSRSNRYTATRVRTIIGSAGTVVLWMALLGDCAAPFKILCILFILPPCRTESGLVILTMITVETNKKLAKIINAVASEVVTTLVARQP